MLDGELVLRDPDFANLREEYLSWDEADVSLADFLNTPASNPYLSPGSPSVVEHSTPLTDQAIRLHQRLSPPVFSIPAAPSCAVRSLIQRPKMQAGAQRIANLILHTLKSYPLMMLRHDTLPPFIHHSFGSSDVEDTDMEPLTNCISLVHMISRGFQGSRKLFWKNVRLECEHLFQEVH